MKSIPALFAVLGSLAIGGTALAASGDELLEANKCGKCHTATTTKKGPSFASVALKYKGEGAASAKLVEMLKIGGDDHNAVKAGDADLKAMVAALLATK